MCQMSAMIQIHSHKRIAMDIVNKIAETATDYSDRPLEEQKMKKVTVDTMGVEYPAPERV